MLWLIVLLLVGHWNFKFNRQNYTDFTGGIIHAYGEPMVLYWWYIETVQLLQMEPLGNVVELQTSLVEQWK